MLHKVRKRPCYFSDPAAYAAELKRNILLTQPVFYSVAATQKIETLDGHMVIMRLVADSSDPGLEPIAECYLNGQNLYFWRDYCWAVAVVNESPVAVCDNSVLQLLCLGEGCRHNKTVCLYQLSPYKVDQ